MSRYLIFGGTGFLGQALSKRLLLSDKNTICVFSRSEDKHRQIRVENPDIKSIIGDVRDYRSCFQALKSFEPDVIIAAQALKQIDLCEQMPYETVQTNIIGTQNLCNAVQDYSTLSFKDHIRFLSISTDKSSSPSTLYGATKLIQERLHLSIQNPIIYNNVCRYGNVLSSTGSIIPVIKERLKNNKEILIMDKRMSRFLLSIDDAINLILKSLSYDFKNTIFIPEVKSCMVLDLIEILIEKYGNKKTKLKEIGCRPLEKIHEIFFSQEECSSVKRQDGLYVMRPFFPYQKDVKKEYSSGDPENLMSKEELKEFLIQKGVIS